MDGTTWIKSGLAAIGTAATYLLGGWDAVMVALVVMVAIDYMAGVMLAFVNKKLDSNIGARGIAKKVGYFLLVALAAIIDQSAGLEAPFLRTVTIWFLIANEGLSITENLAGLGVPIPPALLTALARLGDRGETDA